LPQARFSDELHIHV